MSLLCFSQGSEKLLIGKWQNIVEQTQTWSFEESGRIEIIIECGGPCEGSNETYYVDEAGTWRIENEVVYLIINENNGRPFEPAQKLELPIKNLEESKLTLIWQMHSEMQEMNFEKK